MQSCEKRIIFKRGELEVMPHSQSSNLFSKISHMCQYCNPPPSLSQSKSPGIFWLPAQLRDEGGCSGGRYERTPEALTGQGRTKKLKGYWKGALYPKLLWYPWQWWDISNDRELPTSHTAAASSFRSPKYLKHAHLYVCSGSCHPNHLVLSPPLELKQNYNL